MTLSELNTLYSAFLDRRNVAERKDWSGYTISRPSYAVGRNGSQFTGTRGSSGDKLHLLTIETIIEEPADRKPGSIRKGDFFIIHGACNSNGQRTGRVVAGADLDQITCKTCLKRLGNIKAGLAGEPEAK